MFVRSFVCYIFSFWAITPDVQKQKMKFHEDLLLDSHDDPRWFHTSWESNILDPPPLPPKAHYVSTKIYFF